MTVIYIDEYYQRINQLRGLIGIWVCYISIATLLSLRISLVLGLHLSLFSLLIE